MLKALSMSVIENEGNVVIEDLNYFVGVTVYGTDGDIPAIATFDRVKKVIKDVCVWNGTAFVRKDLVGTIYVYYIPKE